MEVCQWRPPQPNFSALACAPRPCRQGSPQYGEPFKLFDIVQLPSLMCTLRTKPDTVHYVQEESDNIESHWDDYQPPNHPVLHDLDVEE